MPAPLVIVAIAAGTVVLAVLIGLALRRLYLVLSGKRIAVLGAKAVGKTVFIIFLTTGKLVKSYSQNIGKVPFKGGWFRRDNHAIYIQRGFDVPGRGIPDLPDWKRISGDADVIFYLFRIDRYSARDQTTIQRIEDDLQHLRSWNIGEDLRKIILIGTFLDMDKTFLASYGWNNIDGYVSDIRESKDYLRVHLLSGGAPLVLGSLADKASALTLINALEPHLKES
jgi:GTPase SAR1 family protein